MADLIVTGSTVIAPTLILGYESSRPGGAIVHPIIGRPDPDVTLRPAGRRTGTLELLFAGEELAANEAAAAAAEAAHATPAVFTLTSTDRPSLAMSYVVPATGRIARQLDAATRNAWTVRIDFHEVAP